MQLGQLAFSYVHLTQQRHMPFSPIVVNSRTYNQAGDGKYMLSTVTFGNPARYITVKGASLNKDRSKYVLAVNIVQEADVVVGGVTVRKTATFNGTLTTDKEGFTTTIFDGMIADVSDWLSGAILERILAGES